MKMAGPAPYLENQVLGVPISPSNICARHLTWKVGGIITGVGEPAVIVFNSDGAVGDGLAPSTWNPTTCLAGAC